MPLFRLIPSIEELRQRPAVRALESRFGAEALIDALRMAAASVRETMSRNEAGLDEASLVVSRIESLAASVLTESFSPSLEPVINATGVILHTNLGRAPLSDTAVDRLATIARGYSNLEYDLDRGTRGRRDVHAEALLCRLTGAASAVVVNNNAAAALLVLAALGAGREVIVSRGELVEIGGGFRVPDVMAQSGAVLREVGTTNKTRTADYAAAIGGRTALILRVHPSNFRIEGFAERPALTDLVTLARRFNLPLIEDLGSGHLTDRGGHPLSGIEPSVRAAMTDGVDVCCFSGDKLLGGPQSGIIIGRKDLVERIRRHPLMRAVRVDKLTYAALEGTLLEYAAKRETATVPVQRMLAVDARALASRAASLAASIGAMPGWRVKLREGTSAIGGGSAPGVELPTTLIVVEKAGLTADGLESKLRTLSPPLIARIEHDEVVLDLRTVPAADDERLSALLGSLG